ncbi:MAG TPA: LLM class flavin-dependent oxidoreductase [Balneola sp.]|jgi:probable LLM family oxidoreductase|nr:LLM class flavin-dependent oxidoreductase [Balneola sp.]MAO77586.1 LLM class flavin-dependent oxidoreductase [Balneola sp.]MBF63808.1 LLM class flavin-dependent oxidoreductase [Balneola sp.]HAH50589.1 LLM class flavin-dependent oxidoreductase [Balneola sp.]HAW80681.1 LLM class flavin-dependent oxidoreductase [Balneola sp.]|tara:strand:+ start:11784 stop:12812 length:1029 start_codon:yes stop_codon:yes gene_type:complete
MELGLFTFVDNNFDPGTGEKLHPSKRLQNLLEEAELADSAGLDVFGIGEHHREDYVASAPPVMLSAIAARTKRIRLTSTVTVLGSEDPVRVFQQFATLDLLSKGRAEIMVGRGSFIESFPLFGYDLQNYEELFEEKLELLLQLREHEIITWNGKYRASIDNKGVYPQPMQEKIPIWRAVGGTPKSAYLTGALGLPLALAIIGGLPEQFKQFSDLHKRGALDNGKPVQPMSINSHGFIAETSQEAKDIAFPAFKQTMDKIGSERGWPPMSRQQFEASTSLKGANFIGSPQEVIDKILYQHEVFGHDRFLMQMSVGSVPHKKMMKSIELFATKVAPVVRKELGE